VGPGKVSGMQQAKEEVKLSKTPLCNRRTEGKSTPRYDLCSIGKDRGMKESSLSVGCLSSKERRGAYHGSRSGCGGGSLGELKVKRIDVEGREEKRGSPKNPTQHLQVGGYVEDW